MKVYCGRKNPLEAGTGQVFVNGRPLAVEPSLKVHNHSPDGFQWGYGGSGPAQLALALLLDHLGSVKRAEYWHQQFKAQIVANLPACWVVTSEDIDRWLDAVRPEKLDPEELSDGEPQPKN